MTGEHRRVAIAVQFRGIQRQAHHKHEHDQPHLAQRVEVAQARGREQRGGNAWREPAEQRGPQQYPRHHLAHHLWLFDLLEKESHDARRHQNHRDLQHQLEEIEHHSPPFLGA